MADQKINIAIGSSYNGNGMNRALGSIDTLAKNANKAAGAVGSLGGALDGISGTAGKAIGSITKLTSALAVGGPIGLGIAGITALLGAFQSYKEKQDEAAEATQKATEKLKKLQEESAKKAWKDFTSSLEQGRTEAEKLAQSLDKVVALEKALAAAKQGNAQASANLAQTELAAQTASNVRGADTPEEKALEQAKGDVAMAQLRKQSNLASAQANVDSIAASIQSSEKGYQALLDAYDSLEQSIKDLEDSWTKQNADNIEYAYYEQQIHIEKLSDMKSDAEIAAELMKQDENFQKTLKAMQDEQLKINEQINASGLRLAALREQQETAEKTLTQVKVQAAADEAAAKDALIKADNDAAGARLAADEKILQLKQEQAIKEANELGLLEWQQRLEEKKIEHEKSMSKLDDEIKTAKEDLKTAIRRAENAYNAAKAIADGGVWNPNGATIGRKREGASANNIDNAQFVDFAKPKGWDQRYWQTHSAEAAANGVQSGLSQNESREYNRLLNKAASGSEMTDSERKRLHELAQKDPEVQADKAAKKAAEEAEKLEQLQRQKEQEDKQMRQNIQAIADKIRELKGAQ